MPLVKIDARILAAITLAGLVAGSAGAAPVMSPAEKAQQVNRDPKARAAAAQLGRQQAGLCFKCHGEDGNSPLSTIPNLAGQNAVYLAEQLRKFAVGERRDEFMENMVKALSDDEKVNVAMYFASHKVRPAGAPNAPGADAGKTVFTKICFACHGPKGQGDELIPRLAGQHMDYLVRSITRYRDKTGERRDTRMHTATATLTDQDVRNVAAFMSGYR